MKYLVFGGAGFLGANLVRSLSARFPQSQVVAIDSLDPAIGSTTRGLADLQRKVEFIQGDIRDQTLLDRVLPGAGVIFNCAAQTSHPLSIRNPLFDADINILGNLRLLEGIRSRCPEAVVVYPSSSTVIGKLQSKVIDESHPERPLDIYSANKGAAEKYYEIFQNVHGLKTVVLRFANLYGPFGKSTPDFGFFNYFIHRAWSGLPIEVFGSGSQGRNVMHVEDAIEAMIASTQSAELYGKMFFATSPFHHSLKEVADTIVAVFERGKVISVPWPEDRLKIEIGNVKFSSSALERQVGWMAKLDLVEGLKRTRAALEEQEKQK